MGWDLGCFLTKRKVQILVFFGGRARYSLDKITSLQTNDQQETKKATLIM